MCSAVDLRHTVVGMSATQFFAEEPLLGAAELFDLTGRAYVVTGASSGIGRRFVKVLDHAGASVAAMARRERELADSLDGLDRAAPFVGDVTRREDLEACVDACIERFGRIDGVINNAGIIHSAPAEAESSAEFRRVIEVNLNAVFDLAQIFAQRRLGEGGGVVLNVSSIFGQVASGQIPQASYAASKSAVVNLTRELAAQWARRGIRVNAIAPGWFPSEMSSPMFREDGGGLNYIRSRTPMGRPGTLAELDGILLFLLSDASSYVTGQTVIVDGGWCIV